MNEPNAEVATERNMASGANANATAPDPSATMARNFDYNHFQPKATIDTQNSGATTPATDSYSFSTADDDGSAASSQAAASNATGYGWLGGITSDFRSLATSIKSTVPQAIGDFADFVHQSAIHVAAEIAELEREQDARCQQQLQERRGTPKKNEQSNDAVSLAFPWEVKHASNGEPRGGDERQDSDAVYLTDQKLMDLILDISLHQDSFLQPFPMGATASNIAPLDAAQQDLVARILDVDDKLSAMFSHLSARDGFDATLFWRNYLNRCEEVRQMYFNGDGTIPSVQRLISSDPSSRNCLDTADALGATANTTAGGGKKNDNICDISDLTTKEDEINTHQSNATTAATTLATKNAIASGGEASGSAQPSAKQEPKVIRLVIDPAVVGMASSDAPALASAPNHETSADTQDDGSGDAPAKCATSSSLVLADDSSLVPASLADDSSYVIPSAPPSTMSIEDMVVVRDSCN